LAKSSSRAESLPQPQGAGAGFRYFKIGHAFETSFFSVFLVAVKPFALSALMMSLTLSEASAVATLSA